MFAGDHIDFGVCLGLSGFLLCWLSVMFSNVISLVSKATEASSIQALARVITEMAVSVCFVSYAPPIAHLFSLSVQTPISTM